MATYPEGTVHLTGKMYNGLVTALVAVTDPEHERMLAYWTRAERGKHARGERDALEWVIDEIDATDASEETSMLVPHVKPGLADMIRSYARPVPALDVGHGLPISDPKQAAAYAEGRRSMLLWIGEELKVPGMPKRMHDGRVAS